MYALFAALSLTCFIELASADTGVCQNLWVTLSGLEGSPPQIYVSESNTYTLATPYQTQGSATGQAWPPVTTLSLPKAQATSPTVVLIPSLSASNIVNGPSSTLPTPPSTSIVPTQNGWCGASHNDTSCLGWPLGQCCSQYSSCGSSIDYCGAGCQSEFGNCGSSSPSPTGPQIIQSSPAAVIPPTSSAAVMIPSPSPSPAPVCTPLVVFYSAAHYKGTAYEACGSFGVCQNVPKDIANQASSLAWSDANSCSLFNGLGCSGDQYFYSNGDDKESFFSNFNDETVSYICYSTYGP